MTWDPPKAIAVGLTTTAAYRFIAKDRLRTAAVYGGIGGASVLMTDFVVSYISVLPSMFSFLKSYAMDAVSSLIASVMSTLVETYYRGNGIAVSGEMIRELFMNFIYAFGSTVAGSYITPMFARVLPASLSQRG